MGEYMKRFESYATMKSREMEEDEPSIPTKKRKLYSEIQNEYTGDVENSVSPSLSRTSSCSNHEESSEYGVKRSLRSPDLENVDLEAKGFETENSTSIVDRIFSREATPTSELRGDSEPEPMYSPPISKKKSPPPVRPRRRIPAEKIPSEAELEEFFAAAERCEAKRFAEKYNFDIVKDVPLEGRYQWICLLP